MDMRKSLFLALLMVGMIAFLSTTALAANTDTMTDDDMSGMDGGEFAYTYFETFEASGGEMMEAPIGYDTTGELTTTSTTLDTANSAPPGGAVPAYTIPCPNLDGDHWDDVTCDAWSTYNDPQTEDKGSATSDEDPIIIIDDLYSALADMEEDSTEKKKMGVDQALDILFYHVHNTSLSGGWKYSSGSSLFPIGLGIDQTLDQDVADFHQSTDSEKPYDGTNQKLFQEFEIARSTTMHDNLGTGAMQVEDHGLIDQWLYAYVEDNTTGSPTQVHDPDVGISQSYSSWFAMGQDRDECFGIGCDYTYTGGHEAVTKTANAPSRHGPEP